jgi:hypothetical protein
MVATLMVATLMVALASPLGSSAAAEEPTATAETTAVLAPDVKKALRQSPVAGKEVADRIAFLITQLDSINYLARESAASELVNIGGLAIGPLARHSLECSPEQCWRIKKTLEQICTSGDEEIFFRAFGILQVRFDGGNVAMSQKMVELQNKWKLKRKQEAISKLRSKGAEVIDPWEDINTFENIQLGLGGNVIFLNGRPVELFDGNQPVATTNRSRTKSKTLSEKELKSKIDKILNSDLEETRELVLGDAEITSAAIPTAADPFGDQIIINQAIFARAGFPRSYRRGIAVSLSNQWSGSEEDLEALKALTNLTEVSIKDLDLSRNAIQSIASLPTLGKLVFDGGRLRPDDLEVSEWSPTLGELEFANQEITTALIERCASIQSLQKLSFDQCELQDSVLDQLKTLSGLRGLEFKKTEINASIFGAIAELKTLTAVNLTACKFKTRDFEQLKSERPQLQVTFTAQAFLGVRGPVDVIQLAGGDERDSPGCLVSEVISGSGADLAGMRVGDVIESVDRQAIVKFEDLRLHIAQHLPGDKLNIIVQRSGKPVEMVVELGDINSVPNN